MQPLKVLVCVGLASFGAGAQDAPAGTPPHARGPFSWYAKDRAAKVAALIPGSKMPAYTPETLFAEWTKQQVERWNAKHPAVPADQAYREYAATAPTDAELVRDFPRHIAPFGQVRSGKPDRSKRDNVLITYCPFCQSRSFSLAYDPNNDYHAATNCCRTELYGRPQDFPPGYALAPNSTARFLRLDGTSPEIPCTIYRDTDGVEWELFIKTLFDQRRWLREGCDLVRQYGREFRDTANPLCAHKIAVILDEVADTYYGLPLCYRNQLAMGKDGKPLTRVEWEAVPRPAIFKVSYLGGWNRRRPIFNKGWINMSDEHIWVEPFARVRHHPAFKHYSQRKYGAPNALDRKVMTKMLREVALMFRSVFSQKLLTNYQEANYVDMWLLGLLVQDRDLIDFAGPAQVATLYNHTYQDGMNGEGAPNYMAMPGGYFYPYLRDPKGWLEFYPRFLDDHPFYWAANNEMRRLRTVRGLQVEFGDQHEYAYDTRYITDPARVRANEKIGSRNWAGYGVGILRVGGPGHRQEVCISYTRATLHNAQDALSMGCWVDGVPVMRRGGYAASSRNAHLQWERPEFQALKKMGYPREIAECERGFGRWSWIYAHSPLCQNGATVDEVATGRGWGDNRGYGEVVTFKGGESAGQPGSSFQVLDVRDHYSWSRVDKAVRDFRRTLIGVEGPDGRPYVLDLLKLDGGRRHALYNSAWADRAEDSLPRVESNATHLAQAFFGGKLPEDNTHYRNFEQVRNVERLARPGPTWDLTWATDMAAYAPRDPRGRPFRRPLPDDEGKVRLRLIGFTPRSGRTELIRGQGPWIGVMRQPLPQGPGINGNVAFMDARDFLVEHRTASPEQPALTSLFVHVLEGYQDGERSAIRSAVRLEATSVAGPARDVLALKLEMRAGHTDTVIYQSAAGRIELPDGLRTDARYAVLRRDAKGEVMAAEVCRGTYLRISDFSVSMPGDFTGAIVDVIGDLTGTRQQSALVIRPDAPWPVGDGLADRQLLIRVESPLRAPCNEGYRIKGATALPGGLVRVDLQDHAPFVTSWHEVVVLPKDRPNVLRTNRPMVDHGNNPWYNGLKIWFPKRDKTYTIRNVNRVGGGYGGDTLEVVEDVDLAAEGIRLGDWYVIYGIEPGRRVTVANELCWRREQARDWQQHALRVTGAATVRTSVTRRPLSYRTGEGRWLEAADGKQTFTSDETRGRPVRIVSDKPPWLDLNDDAGPALLSIALDGKAITAEAARDLGWIDSPRRLVLRFRDAENPIDASGVSLRLNRKQLNAPGSGVVTMSMSEAGKSVAVEVDMAKALAEDSARPRRHVIEVAAADRSVEAHATAVVISFINRVALDESATYLSDLKPVKSFAHGGLIRDTDYIRKVAMVAGRVYPKCLTLCPEPSPEGTHGEAVYKLPPRSKAMKFETEIGISDSSRGRGSAMFIVQTGASPAGPWQTLYTSPIRRGSEEPLKLSLPLGSASFLRLYTTDAGDGINSDHAVWGDAKLK